MLPAVAYGQANEPTLAAKGCADTHDIIVVGGTPGGIAAAITAARLGRSVAIVEYHRHLGGMTTSGLGKTDIETREAIGGVFREFVGRVLQHYREEYGADSENVRLCRDGYYYEPSVAQKVIDRMVADESKIKVFRHHRLAEVLRDGKRVIGVRVEPREGGPSVTLRGRMFIDATYEGDLAAAAGARYRLGRESRAEFGELHAGVVYQDFETRAFLSGTTGEGDKRLQAYTYRLCLTSDPANSVPCNSPPPGYERTRYLGYLDDWKAGRLGAPKKMQAGVGYFAPTFGTVVRALSIAEIPNRKYDVNMNPRPLSFPFTGENEGYPESDWPRREEIALRIRNLTLGLLYFLQHDTEVPAEHRDLARKYQLARDEFVDNDHFPWQLYVREARRIVGLYTLSERDVTVGPDLGRTPIHADSIAAGEYPIDSFPVRKREPGHDKALEGYLFMQAELTRPYQIPYRILVPETIDALLVPVAASTTHVAFSSIRLEPTWMALGQAAGTAAHLALIDGRQPRDVDVEALQRLLLKQGQVLTWFSDLDRKDPAHDALQFLGAKGFFPTYRAESQEPLDLATAAAWLRQFPKLSRVDSEAEHPPTRAELAAVLPGKFAANDLRPVTRGEFCQALYEWLATQEAPESK